MPIFDVLGQAYAPVDVRYRIEAETENEAMEIASRQFAGGDRGVVSYSDDDAAAVDFMPLHAGLAADE
jgi:hypothetical protein